MFGVDVVVETVEVPIVPGMRPCSSVALVVWSWVTAIVFDEEASILLVCNLHLMNHSIVFNFERCNLVREYVIRGHGLMGHVVVDNSYISTGVNSRVWNSFVRWVIYPCISRVSSV